MYNRVKFFIETVYTILNVNITVCTMHVQNDNIIGQSPIQCGTYDL